MVGKLYGIGVGPGDSELMTIKAVNRIRACNIVAFPGKNPEESVAYHIAKEMIPDIEQKRLLPLEMPMSLEKDVVDRAHNAAVTQIEKFLDQGEDVVFLVLGDVTLYSTFMYLANRVKERRYEVEIISGVTSFSASAAAAGISLCQWDEKLHIIPSRHEIPNRFESGENYVLMKVGNQLANVRTKIKEANRNAIFVENCGMENERIYCGVDNMPDHAGYYSIVIVTN